MTDKAANFEWGRMGLDFSFFRGEAYDGLKPGPAKKIWSGICMHVRDIAKSSCAFQEG